MRSTLLLVPLALLVGGCGGSSPNAARDDAEQRGLQFARCMREHGVDIPDPVAGRSGQQAFRVGGGPGRAGRGPDPARLEAADKACRKYEPDGGKPPSAAEQQEMRDQALAFSKCMRSHGVTGFPDPKFEGNGGVQSGGPGSTFNPSSPTFQAAQKECGDLMGPPPGRGGDGGPALSTAP